MNSLTRHHSHDHPGHRDHPGHHDHHGHTHAHGAAHPLPKARSLRCGRRRAALALSGLAIAFTPGVAAADTAGPTTPTVPTRAEYACETGEFCVWPHADYGGPIVRLDLRNTNPDECRPLPDGVAARSFANRIDRHVTVYQDGECSTEADFSTYPGPGTFVPRSPYVVRAVQIWN
ncbi:peptidase inhibitor family I36 protein [Saccharomonospora xinjiangensis]|uniref:peptidase inhibitor family I36 protein n=1 Tax=Saccharomonospora xinjiangensis TaxID=75294 RepID=UPI00107041B6|nr:peptidase inhibitor family I36 protein [Saccharomonospora xinjiangensis]